MSRAAEVVAKARARGVMLATAESCTGGMVAAAITDIPGSSDVFDRGIVTYSNAAKTELLGVRPDTLAAHGAVSNEVAAEMAGGALRAFHAQIAVSTTGIAGPGGSEHKPEGRVCFGIATDAMIETRMRDFGPLGRDAVRRASVEEALAMILEALESIPPKD